MEGVVNWQGSVNGGGGVCKLAGVNWEGDEEVNWRRG